MQICGKQSQQEFVAGLNGESCRSGKVGLQFRWRPNQGAALSWFRGAVDSRDSLQLAGSCAQGVAWMREPYVILPAD